MITLFRREGASAQPLTSARVDEVRALLAQNAACHTVPGARLEELARNATAHREFSIFAPGDEIEAVAWHGVSLSVIQSQRRSTTEHLTRRALRQRRQFSSIVGEPAVVADVWAVARRTVGEAREIRAHQPVLEFSGQASASPHPGVRAARADEAQLVYPASVRMFREEVGSDPAAADGGRAYWSRVRSLIDQGRTFLVREGDTIVFKADVGAVFGGVAQLQGVWVDPRYRRQGIGSSAMAALAPLVAESIAPRVSLYVNDFNTAARSTYAASGFVQRSELATVLLA